MPTRACCSEYHHAHDFQLYLTITNGRAEVIISDLEHEYSAQNGAQRHVPVPAKLPHDVCLVPLPLGFRTDIVAATVVSEVALVLFARHLDGFVSVFGVWSLPACTQAL